MTGRSFSDEEKLKEVEQLIVELRPYRNDPDSPWHDTYFALKSVALDIRAKIDPSRKSEVLESLSFRVSIAARAKARIGHVEIGHHQAISEVVLAHWPVVRTALEFNAEKS